MTHPHEANDDYVEYQPVFKKKVGLTQKVNEAVAEIEDAEE